MIVCTGGNGTIGQCLSKSIRRLQTRLEDSIESRKRELLRFGAGYSFIHLAALTSTSEAEDAPERAHFLNVEGTARWLKAASETGCRRFIFASTSHVFKPTPKFERLSVSREPDAVSVYGRTKAKAERVVLSAPVDCETVVARIFSVTAANMRPGFLFADLMRRKKDRDFREVPGYGNVRDFISAEDAARKLERLASAPTLNQRIYHIGSGQALSVRELTEMVFGPLTESERGSLFPATQDAANFLVSEPSVIEENRE